MKRKLYLSAILLFAACVANAQIRKGTVLLGGNLNFVIQDGTNGGVSGNDKIKQTGISIGPSFGKAVKDNLVVGINLGYAYNKYIQPGSTQQDTTTQNGYSIGAYLRQYYPIGSRFYFLFQTQLGFQYTRTRQVTPDFAAEPVRGFAYTTSLNVAPGIAYQLTKKLQLEILLTSLGYMTYAYSNTDNNNTTGIPGKGGSFVLGSSLQQSINNLAIGCRFSLDN